MKIPDALLQKGAERNDHVQTTPRLHMMASVSSGRRPTCICTLNVLSWSLAAVALTRRLSSSIRDGTTVGCSVTCRASE